MRLLIPPCCRACSHTYFTHIDPQLALDSRLLQSPSFNPFLCPSQLQREQTSSALVSSVRHILACGKAVLPALDTYLSQQTHSLFFLQSFFFCISAFVLSHHRSFRWNPAVRINWCTSASSRPTRHITPHRHSATIPSISIVYYQTTKKSTLPEFNIPLPANRFRILTFPKATDADPSTHPSHITTHRQPHQAKNSEHPNKKTI